ncbi:hypothetical protein K439DRAFT_1614544 [Ramaria rubella]|nr:hypothetical protein K439DRAFT_1614544 [Ramaria rubella]
MTSSVHFAWRTMIEGLAGCGPMLVHGRFFSRIGLPSVLAKAQHGPLPKPSTHLWIKFWSFLYTSPTINNPNDDEVAAIEEFSLFTISKFKAFPINVTHVDHEPYFPSEKAEQWCRLQPLQLFIANRSDLAANDGLCLIDTRINRVTVAQLKGYCRFVGLQLLYNSAEKWVKEVALKVYLEWCQAQGKSLSQQLSG